MAHRMCVLFGRCQSAHVSLPATIGVHVGQSAHIAVLATAALATNAPSLRHTCLRRPSICFPSAPVDLLAVSFPDHRRHRCASHQHLPISWPPSSSIILMLLEVNFYMVFAAGIPRRTFTCCMFCRNVYAATDIQINLSTVVRCSSSHPHPRPLALVDLLSKVVARHRCP